MTLKMKPLFKRILLKLSGEGLMGDRGFGVDEKEVVKLAAEIVKVKDLGVQVCVVVGGGNFFRGARNTGEQMDRSVADQIGMMATVMNALTIKSSLEHLGCRTRIFSGLLMPQVCETYTYRDAIKAVTEGDVVIFAGGTGCPYFTTDTGATLRAAEMHCDVVMKATQVDGVYDSDPKQNPQAVRYAEISYAEVLEKGLKVMDITAVSMAQDNHIPVMVFARKGENSIVNAVCGAVKCTIIK